MVMRTRTRVMKGRNGREGGNGDELSRVEVNNMTGGVDKEMKERGEKTQIHVDVREVIGADDII